MVKPKMILKEMIREGIITDEELTRWKNRDEYKKNKIDERTIKLNYVRKHHNYPSRTTVTGVDCSHCTSSNVVKDGFVNNKRFGRKQIYKCRHCGRRFNNPLV